MDILEQKKWRSAGLGRGDGLCCGDRDASSGGGMDEIAVEEMSFEQAMAELERVLGLLERGDAPLEDSIGLYERGAALKKRCETKLREAEEKVAAITLDGAGAPAGTTAVDGL